MKKRRGYILAENGKAGMQSVKMIYPRPDTSLHPGCGDFNGDRLPGTSSGRSPDVSGRR
jgi:hypothetical protein